LRTSSTPSQALLYLPPLPVDQSEPRGPTSRKSSPEPHLSQGGDKYSNTHKHTQPNNPAGRGTWQQERGWVTASQAVRVQGDVPIAKCLNSSVLGVPHHCMAAWPRWASCALIWCFLPVTSRTRSSVCSSCPGRLPPFTLASTWYCRTEGTVAPLLAVDEEDPDDVEFVADKATQHTDTVTHTASHCSILIAFASFSRLTWRFAVETLDSRAAFVLEDEVSQSHPVGLLCLLYLLAVAVWVAGRGHSRHTNMISELVERRTAVISWQQLCATLRRWGRRSKAGPGGGRGRGSRMTSPPSLPLPLLGSHPTHMLEEHHANW
jgi:hypothetical protein